MATGKRKVTGRTLTLNEVKIEYNLVSIFDKAFSGNTPKDKAVRNELRPYISEASIKYLFGQTVAREIRDRTARLGVDIDSEDFEKYSEEYTESEIFEIYGKSERPNLKLTGDMMASITSVPKVSGRNVTVKISDTLNILKAYNHCVGDTVNQRDFFGLPIGREEVILKEIILDANKDNVLGTLESFVGDIELQSTQLNSIGANGAVGQEIEISQQVINEVNNGLR